MPLRHPLTCYVIGFLLLLFLGLAVASIVAIHLNEAPLINRSPWLRTSAMCAAFGMLGASIAATRKYYKVLITESASRELGKADAHTVWDFGWTFYYLTRPILGAILGALAFVFVFIGFEILSISQNSSISRQGNMMLYAISLLSGYSVSQVLDRLNAVAKQVFAPNPPEGEH